MTTTPIRWTPARKAEVVKAVRADALTLDQACQRFSLSVEEFLAWQQAVDRGGKDALKQKNRKAGK